MQMGFKLSTSLMVWTALLFSASTSAAGVCISFRDCGSRSACYGGECQCVSLTGNMGPACDQITVASSFIIAGCTLLVFMYFFLLCTHLMFLNAASGKGHPAMRIIRQLYHVLSIFKALSLVIADSMVIYISSGRGNIHRLVLNEGSSFMILEIVYVISTIILAVLIPSVWIQVAQRLGHIKAKFGCAPRTIQIGTTLLIIVTCAMYTIGYVRSKMKVRQAGLLLAEIVLFTLFNVSAGLLVGTCSPFKVIALACSGRYVYERSGDHNNQQTNSRVALLQPKFTARGATPSKKVFQGNFETVRQNRLSAIIQFPSNTNTYSSDIQPNSSKEPSDPAVHDAETERGTQPTKQEQIGNPINSTQASEIMDPAAYDLQLMILIFTCRMVLCMATVLAFQVLRALTITKHHLLGLAFLSKIGLESTVLLMNYICTGYLYGYYPLEFLDVFRSRIAGAFDDMVGRRQEVAKTESTLNGPVGC